MTERRFSLNPDEALLPEKIVLLVVDDDPSVIQVTRLVLSRYQYQGRPLEILAAGSAAEARQLLDKRTDIAVILLDVVMESDDAGLHLVEYIRHSLNDFRIRILLRTGQPGYAPERRVVQDYDINDYLMKADATQARLVVSLTTAIRGYADILRAEALARQVQRSEQERESARQASQQKTQFLAHMSHEIRTPLNGIIGIIALLDEEPLPSFRQELMEDLRLSSDALLGIVNDVLDVAKIEAGKLELVPVAFNLRQLLKKACAVFSAALQQKQIGFHLSAEDLPEQTFVADAQRLQQILINYLSNAQKFTPSGGHIELRVQCREVTAGEWQLYAEVEDSGPGIRPGRLAGIFDAYEQESAGTSLQYGGTGLGLSLSRSLAELMGGQVGADSEPGRGSCFWLRVPLQIAGQAEDAAAPAWPGTDLSGMVILLAEDDLTSQKVLRRVLERQGAEVYCFDNGEALLASGLAQRADVVLLDYYMPGMSGPECARQLRREGIMVPLLGLTAAVTTTDIRACLAAGMSEVQSKPLDYQRLLHWLQQHGRR